MAEYIERERIYAAISRFLITKNAVDFTHYEEGRDDAITDAMKTIKKFPAADVRPERHGRWITRHKGLPFCSECDYNGLGYIAVDLDYCPKCGAKMTGGE